MSSCLLHYSYWMGTASLGTTSEFQLERELAKRQANCVCSFLSWKENLSQKYYSANLHLIDQKRATWPLLATWNLGNGLFYLFQPLWWRRRIIVEHWVNQAIMCAALTNTMTGSEKGIIIPAWVMSLSLQLGKDTIYFNRSKFRVWLGWQKWWLSMTLRVKAELWNFCLGIIMQLGWVLRSILFYLNWIKSRA